MPYLTLQDYYLKIQDANLQQVISDEDKYRVIAQNEALETIKSYLRQKFDITEEFRETVQFSYTTAYYAKQLVYLDADAYSATATYALNALTLYQGQVYYNKTAITVGEAFTGSKWTLIGDQYDLFYVTLPADEFDYEGVYLKDDLVWRDNKVYKALRDTLQISQGAKLQYGEYDQVPGVNEYPETDGQTQWSAGVTYSFSGVMPSHTSADYTAYNALTAYTAGQKASINSIIYLAIAASTGVTPGTNFEKWLPLSYTEGDNRNPILVGMNVTMAIYKLSPRISPYNVPDVWVKNNDLAISWLKQCACGDVTLDMPLLQPNKKRIRHGGSIKNINNY